jgi:GTP-binding protein HflX
VEELLPRPNIAVAILVPYDRGDIVSEVHTNGEVRRISYEEAGTAIEADVPAWLAAAVAPFAVAG